MTRRPTPSGSVVNRFFTDHRERVTGNAKKTIVPLESLQVCLNVYVVIYVLLLKIHKPRVYIYICLYIHIHLQIYIYIYMCVIY